MSEIPLEWKERGYFSELFFSVQAALLSAAIVHPLETLKVHRQLKAEGHRGAVPKVLSIARNITSEFGFLRLWAGVEPALLSRASYIGLRLKTYNDCLGYNLYTRDLGPVRLESKAFSADYSGGVSAFLHVPLDHLALRMQSDLLLPATQRKNYGLLIPALFQLYDEVGFYSLWRGALLTIFKAIVLNAGLVVSYDQFLKLVVSKVGEFVCMKLAAAYCAAMVGCFLAQPFDSVKTRLQSQFSDNTGSVRYSGMSNCFKKTILGEGVSGLYVGYWTHVAKVGPQAFIALKLLDYFDHYL